MDKQDNHAIQSVRRACLLLESIGAQGEAGVRELARSLGLGKSSVQRLASTLEQMGYLRQSRETGKYSLSLKLLELGNRALERYGLPEAAEPIVQELARTTNEAVHVAVLDQGTATFIECARPTHLVRVFTRVGMRVPCHVTATGKVLLAFGARDRSAPVNDPVQLIAALSGGDESFAHELDLVRARRYAVNDEEQEAGLRAVAAPIWDHSGCVVAAIGIAGPSYRIARAALDQLGVLARTAGDEISEHLGFSPRRGGTNG